MVIILLEVYWVIPQLIILTVSKSQVYMSEAPNANCVFPVLFWSTLKVVGYYLDKKQRLKKKGQHVLCDADMWGVVHFFVFVLQLNVSCFHITLLVFFQRKTGLCLASKVDHTCPCYLLKRLHICGKDYQSVQKDCLFCLEEYPFRGQPLLPKALQYLFKDHLLTKTLPH